MQFKHITDGGLGAEPRAVAGFWDLGAEPLDTRQFSVIFWEKIAILMLLNRISLVFKAI